MGKVGSPSRVRLACGFLIRIGGLVHSSTPRIKRAQRRKNGWFGVQGVDYGLPRGALVGGVGVGVAKRRKGQ